MDLGVEGLSAEDSARAVIFAKVEKRAESVHDWIRGLTWRIGLETRAVAKLCGRIISGAAMGAEGR